MVITHYIYIALFCFSKHSMRSTLSGGISSSTTSVQQPCGWCDGSQSAPEHQLTGGEETEWCSQSAEMRIVRRPWWSEANGRIWPGCRCHTSTLFERHPGIFNDHRESGPWFNVSSEGRCFLQYSVPVTIPGTHTDCRVSTPCTNTSSSSNLVFSGGLPSRYWPCSTLLSFSG